MMLAKRLAIGGLLLSGCETPPDTGVAAPIIVAASHSGTSTILVGAESVFVWVVVADPEPGLAFVWTLNGSSELSDVLDETSTTVTSTVELTAALVEREGQLQCSAQDATASEVMSWTVAPDEAG